MVKRYLSALGLLFALLLPYSAHAAEDIADSLPGWTPQAGDTFVVNVPTNIGYLVHADGRFVSFPVATGRQKHVYYIGRSYEADTPLQSWIAKNEEIQNDRRTFGPTGRFLRLFVNGESSHYGIHSYYKVTNWMEEDKRYFSMGCIVVTEDILNVIEKTFDVSSHSLPVITTDNLEAAMEKLVTATPAPHQG